MPTLNNYRQPSGSNLCGPCCVKMVLESRGVNWDIETISRECKTLPGGTLESGIMLGLLTAGLKPTFYVSPHTETFNGIYARMLPEEVAKDFQERATKTKNKVRKKCFQEFAEVAKSGSLKFKLPSREEIQQKIDEGYVWIVGIRAYVLYNWQYNRNIKKGHFVVIQGYNDKNFIINDPAFDEGGVREVEKDKLLFAMYSTSEGAGICV